MSDVMLCQGDTLQLPLQDGCVQCVVCSPPYWNLRDYQTATWLGGDPACLHSPTDTPGKRGLASSTLSGGKQTTGHQREGYHGTCPRCGAERHDQQLGMEALHDCLAWARSEPPCETPCYICQMRRVFAECSRVLRQDGTLWINIADSYNAAGRTGHGTRIGYKQCTNRASATGTDACRPTAPGLKEKDLCGIPHRLALALQSDGWYWRSEIIWNKLNPMPESCTDRPTKAHEQVFLFSKQPRYFMDMEAIREPTLPDPRDRLWSTARNGTGFSDHLHDDERGRMQTKTQSEGWVRMSNPAGRNARSVWAFASEPTPFAHFATMPTALVSRCILAGSSTRCCPQCHTPYARQTDHGLPNKSTTRGQQSWAGGAGQRDNRGGLPWRSVTTLGFVSTCACITQALSDGFTATAQHMDWLTTPVPSLVFDPFSGSGTTALTARALGRHGVGVELSWEYLKLSRERLGLAALDRWQGVMDSPSVTTTYKGLPLFTALEESI